MAFFVLGEKRRKSVNLSLHPVFGIFKVWEVKGG